MFAESFLACQRKLARREWQAALEVMVDVQRDHRRAGLHLEPLAGRDDLWSARVTQDIRLIALRQQNMFIPLYVDHHDDAYRWAQTRRVIRDHTTGNVSILNEEVRERTIATYGFSSPLGLLDAYDDRLLLDYGFPTSLLTTLRNIRTEDHALDVAERLSSELGERLLALATGDLALPLLPQTEVTAAIVPVESDLPPARPEPTSPPTPTPPDRANTRAHIHRDDEILSTRRGAGFERAICRDWSGAP